MVAVVVAFSATGIAFAIAIGRGVRYLALGFLAVTYGERAMAYMSENGTRVSLISMLPDPVFRARRLSGRSAQRVIPGLSSCRCVCDSEAPAVSGIFFPFWVVQ